MSNELVSIDSERTLTEQQYSRLADVPPEVEWLANITNAKTRRFYKKDVAEFVSFTGLKDSAVLRTVARSHIIAWRKNMELRPRRRPASDASSRSGRRSYERNLCRG